MIGITPSIELLCSLLAPLFAVLTIVQTYEFTRMIKDDTSGLVAAALVAMVPALVRQTAAGLFDACKSCVCLSSLLARRRRRVLSTKPPLASVGIWVSLIAFSSYASALRDPGRYYLGYVSSNAVGAAVGALCARYIWPIAAWLPVASAFHCVILLTAKCVCFCCVFALLLSVFEHACTNHADVQIMRRTQCF